MGVEVKSGGEGVIVADRGCNDGCCCNGRNSGWAQVTGFRGETKELWQMEGRVQRDLKNGQQENQVSYREHC